MTWTAGQLVTGVFRDFPQWLWFLQQKRTGISRRHYAVPARNQDWVRSILLFTLRPPRLASEIFVGSRRRLLPIPEQSPLRRHLRAPSRADLPTRHVWSHIRTTVNRCHHRHRSAPSHRATTTWAILGGPALQNRPQAHKPTRQTLLRQQRKTTRLSQQDPGARISTREPKTTSRFGHSLPGMSTTCRTTGARRTFGLHGSIL